LGVGVSTLVRQAVGRQLALFDEGGSLETERDRTLSRAVDRVQERFGRGALSPGRIFGSGDRRIDG
ncbi:MAG: hypothetical protein OEO23_13905, partial [Gemmatimonadota bacterium]|nr:hypothetical protein [Gemmatimonadota bacterium]